MFTAIVTDKDDYIIKENTFSDIESANAWLEKNMIFDSFHSNFITNEKTNVVIIDKSWRM